MTRTLSFLLLITGFLLMFAVNPAVAENLNIDIGSVIGTPSASYGAASGQAGTWNTISTTGTTSNLLDISGAPTAVDINHSPVISTAAWTPGCSGDPNALLADNFYTADYYSANWSINITSLTDGVYTVYLYAPSNSAVSTGFMTVNGTPVSSIPGSPTCALIDGTSYTSLQTTVTGGTLVISGINENLLGLAGIQLVGQQTSTVPTMTEWGMIIFMVLAGIGSICYLRRRQALS